MPFLKRTIIWTLFLVFMYLGGTAAQSSSNFLQGMGFVSMVIACVCLYIIFKLIWSPLNSWMRTAIVCGVVLFMAFSIGLFDGNTLQSFLNGSPRPMKVVEISMDEQQKNVDELGIEMFGYSANSTSSQTENVKDKSVFGNVNDISKPDDFERRMPVHSTAQNNVFFNKIKMLFNNHPKEEYEPKVLSPNQYPEISGHPKVLSGSVLILDGIKIKLFGIEAPEPTQTCENKYGNSYICGKESIIWMRNWLNHKNIRCRLLSQIQNGWTTGICFSDDGQYDVAAAIVGAGWAVAYTEHTQIYIPYEQKAAEEKRGLWAGRFYKPWDWRKIQSRKGEVKFKKNPAKWLNIKGWF